MINQGKETRQWSRGRDRGQEKDRVSGCGRSWNPNKNNSNYERGESSTRRRGRGKPKLRYEKS